MSDYSPPNLTVDSLEKAHFGDPDATRDTLIQEQLCICRIRAVSDFLQDRSTILVGDRGSGKTAIFELLKAGRLEFSTKKPIKNVIVPVSESLDYKTLESIVSTKIQSKTNDVYLHHRAIWEFLILYKIINKLNEIDNLPDNILEIISKVNERFDDTNRGQGFFATFTNGKKRVGVKLDVSPAGFTVPDFYAQMGAESPTPTLTTGEVGPGAMLQIGKMKSIINDFAGSRGIKLQVLIDKIDEFVVRDEYRIQKAALNALMSVEQGFLAYEHMSLKLFIRSDLFSKLNLSAYGADKVVARKVDLRWSDEEIRDFLAKRILYNFLRMRGADRMALQVNTEAIYLDSKSNYDAIKPTPMARVLTSIIKKKNYLLAKSIGLLFPTIGGGHFRRRSNFNDRVNRILIQMFFGESQSHLTEDGQQTMIDTMQYLSTHFKTGGGASTPRIMLMFMDEALRSSIDFYRKNSCVTVDDPVVPFSASTEIYHSFRAKLWEAINLESQGGMEKLRAAQFHLKHWNFTAEELAETSEISRIEIGEKLSLLTNLGALACSSRYAAVGKRVYHIPLLFRELLN